MIKPVDERPQLVLGDHTIAEREQFIMKHMEICTRNTRRKRYNTKTSGPAIRGTMSVHMAQRTCATKQWKKKVKREMARAEKTQA